MATTDFKDYYSILGVSKTATADDIKKSFRKLALKYHPDRNPGDKNAEARFKEISEAYEVLFDPEKRKKYDQFGQYWKHAEQPQGYKGGTNVDVGGFDFSQYGSFDEFINELLGRFSSPGGTGQRTYSYGGTDGQRTGYSGFGGFGEQGASVEGDREATIRLNFSEAFHGVQKRLNIGTEMIDVRIPAGAKSGSKIRVKGKGSINNYSQQRGDLYLNVELEPHPFFQFEGDQLICEVPVTPDEAVLGISLEVPTPDGMVTMKVPSGIRSGQSLRLRGKGWSNPKGGRGDQLVKIAIATPTELNPTEREYYEKIRQIRTYNPRSNFQQFKL